MTLDTHYKKQHFKSRWGHKLVNIDEYMTKQAGKKSLKIQHLDFLQLVTMYVFITAFFHYPSFPLLIADHG